MRRLLLVFILASIIHTANSQTLTEYREVTFLPDGAQQIGKNWAVINITNEYNLEIYDINISYRGITISIPAVKQDENFKVYSLNFEPQMFNLSIFAVVEETADGFRVKYVVENNYSNPLEIRIEIPPFDGFVSCDKCISGENITYAAVVPPEGNRSFNLSISGNSFTIPDGDVKFSIESSAPLKFKTPLSFSIEKSYRNGKWFARFDVKNPFESSVNVSLKAWAVVDSISIDLFSINSEIKSGEILTVEKNVTSSSPPVFYLRVEGEVVSSIGVIIVPAKKVGEKYIAGYGILKGLSGEKTTPARAETRVVPPPPSEIAPQVSPSPIVTQPPTPILQQRKIELNILQPEVPEFTIPTPARVYVAMMIPATYGLMIFLIVSPVFSSRGVVVDGNALNPRSYALFRSYGRRIYVPPSSAYPGCFVVQPSEELVTTLMENYNLTREEAETIALAVNLKKPLFTLDRRLAELALRSGCLAFVLGEGYGRA